MIVGNKRDQYQDREVSTEEAKALTNGMGCEFFETSAKMNTNVEAAFKALIRQIKVSKGGVVGGTKKKKGKGKKCVIL